MRGFDGEKRRRPKGAARRHATDEAATSSLHELAVKAQHAFEATAQGDLVSREAAECAGLTADDCALARQLEWRRKRLDVLRPGMSPEARKEAVALAAVNATLPRRAGIWTALQDLLAGSETHSGRLELGTKMDATGSCPVILLHSRREVREAVTDGPILALDATMPVRIVQYFLPRLKVLADVQAAAPFLDTFQILGGWGKTTIIPAARASRDENIRREGLLCELRDFVVLHGGSNALVVTYDAIEGRFADLPGVRTGHFNAIAGLDTFGDVRSLFVIGRPLPQPTVHRRMAMALTGRPIPAEQPHSETRGQRMTDGSGTAMQVRAYADPDLEALRVAITDNEVLQAAGRGRAINRTAPTPLALFIMADVVVPMPVKRILRWTDARPTVQQRMAARGLALESPTDASRLYPDLFSSMEAAKKAFQRTSRGTFPYDSLFIGECPPAPLAEGRYRPSGSGRKNRRMWISRWRRLSARADLEAVLGPLAMFKMSGTNSAEPIPDTAVLAVLSDASKLALRACLQAAHPPPASHAAQEAEGRYGCKLTPDALFPVSTAYAPIAGLWTVRRLDLTPIEVIELARGEILPLPVPADRAPPPFVVLPATIVPVRTGGVGGNSAMASASLPRRGGGWQATYRA